MGLAPYGTPRFAAQIRDHLLDLKADGSFRLDLDCFGFLEGQAMTSTRFATLFGPPRRPEDPMTQQHCDLAASIQQVTEEIVLRLARTLHALTGEENLCLAGGVALNCVANARLLREGPFRRIWVQPAAGDAGGALGAALAYHHLRHEAPRISVGPADAMRGAFLGPEYSDSEIAAAVAARGLTAEKLAPDALNARLTDRLVDGEVVGYFQGRAEFGPRALGARSILADARSPEMQRRLNLKIKFRESFRPFAPVVLAERATAWFDLPAPSPYMLFTAPVAAARRLHVTEAGDWQARLGTARSVIPAVTHVDFSARVQTVEAGVNPALHALLITFAGRTGCPVLVNTSFNVRGEPPVCHPREALEGFLATEMDCLALGPFFLEKKNQPASLTSTPSRIFAPD
jgi:carbamoyltransferase